MPSVDVIVVLVGGLFACLGLVVLYGGVKYALAWQRLRRTDPVALARADEGPVEIEGVVRPHRETVDAPLEDRETLAYEYELEAWNSERKDWSDVDRGAVAVPFRVADETGTAVVDPDGLDWFLGTEQEREFDPADPPTSVEPFLRGERAMPGADRAFEYDPETDTRYRLTVSRLDAGDDVYVTGSAAPAHEAATDAGTADRVLVEPTGSWLSPSHPYLLADDGEETALRRLRWETVGRLIIGAIVGGLGGVAVYGGLQGAFVVVTDVDPVLAVATGVATALP